HHQFSIKIPSGEPGELLHGTESSWDCYSLSAHPTESGLAMAGDGSRVWLIDLPFELDDASDSVTAGNGHPFQEWHLDQGDFKPKFGLRKRIYVPRVESERCAWLDADEAGANIVEVRLTEDWHLIVVGDSAVEIYQLNPLRRIIGYSYPLTYSRRVFASN